MVERRVLSPWAAVLTVVVAFGASQIGSGIALVGLAFTLGLRDGLKLEELAREHVLQRYLATPLVVFAAIAVSQVTLAVASLGAAKLGSFPCDKASGCNARASSTLRWPCCSCSRPARLQTPWR